MPNWYYQLADRKWDYIYALGACNLTHIAYIMRCNYRISRVSKEMSESLFKWYMVYILGMVVFFLVAMISFDVITGAGRYTLQPDGHCILINHPLYNTIWLAKISLAINKYIQIAMFAVFLYYFYKLNHRQDISSEHNHRFLMIAAAMGATVGLMEKLYG